MTELPDLGRELSPQGRGLIRLLAEWTAEQLSLGEGAERRSHLSIKK